MILEFIHLDFSTTPANARSLPQRSQSAGTTGRAAAGADQRKNRMRRQQQQQ